MAARKTIKPVNFLLVAPQAREVFLAGDFNGWDLQATPLTRQVDGGWHGQVALPHGHHRYLFVVDGELTLDPRASGVSRNEDDSVCSLISVS